MPSAFGQRLCAPLPVAASVAQLAAPEGKIQKALRCVIGLFFVCCVMAPFAQGLPLSVGNFETGIDVQEQTAESLSQEVLRQTADGFGSNVRQIIEDALSGQTDFSGRNQCERTCWGG